MRTRRTFPCPVCGRRLIEGHHQNARHFASHRTIALVRSGFWPRGVEDVRKTNSVRGEKLHRAKVGTIAAWKSAMRESKGTRPGKGGAA